MASKSKNQAADMSAKDAERKRLTDALDKEFGDYSKDQAGDIVGFWDGESPIVVKPLSVKLIDGSIERNKPAVLFVCELVKATTLQKSAKEDYEPFEGNPGDIIGVWGKPGLRRLAKLGGAEVLLALIGEQDTGKPNPMKVYAVRTKQGVRGSALDVEDNRDKSKDAATFLDARTPVKPSKSEPDDADDSSDDIPF